MEISFSPESTCAHGGVPHRAVEERSGKPNFKEKSSQARTHSIPIWQASVYDFCSISDASDTYKEGGYIYRRMGNPNAEELGDAVARLEGAEAGFSMSSGMGAIAATILSMCGAGDLVVVQMDCYGGAFSLLVNDVARLGINLIFDEIRDLEILEDILKRSESVVSNGEPDSENDKISSDVDSFFDKFSANLMDPSVQPFKARPKRVMVFVETISNPLLNVADVVSISQVCNRYNALLVVDNTFSTMLRDKPIEMGADIVIHSATKFIGGHCDLLAGVVVGSESHIKTIASFSSRMGLTASPMDAWLAVRGLKTLHVRMERSWATATEIASRLTHHKNVIIVRSLPRCSMICFEIIGGLEGSNLVISAFKMITLASSLGGVSTTIAHPSTSSHACLKPSDKARVNITDATLRLSVGLESVDDIWADLERGLNCLDSIEY